MKTDADIRATGMQAPMAALNLVKAGQTIRSGSLRVPPPHGLVEKCRTSFKHLFQKREKPLKM